MPAPYPEFTIVDCSGNNEKRRLHLEEDPSSEEYLLRSYGGPATQSSVTLSSWRQIDGIPSTLLGSTTPLSPVSPRAESGDQKLTLRQSAGRLSAWVKRSGRKVIVRLSQRNQAKEDEVIDYHLAPPELASRPIIELGRSNSFDRDFSPAQELPSEGVGGVHYRYIDLWERRALSGVSSISELPDSEAVELPSPSLSIVELLRDPVFTRDPASRHERDGEHRVAGYAEEYSETHLSPPQTSNSQQSAIISREGTIISNLSSAETAVSSPIGRAGERMDRVSTIARGLTVVGSVKYRCKTPVSPMEAIEIDETGKKSKLLKQHPATRGLLRGKTSGSVYRYASTKASRNENPESNADDLYEDSYRYQEPRTDPDLRTSKQLYEQDLHTTNVVAQTNIVSANVFGMDHAALQKLDEIKDLIEKAFNPSVQDAGRTLKLGQVQGSLESCTAESESSVPPRPVDLVAGLAQGEIESQKREGTASATSKSTSENDCSHQSRQTNEAESSSPIKSATGASSSDLEQDVPTSALSPVSPLSREEQLQHQRSIRKAFDPITPLVSTRPQDQEFVAVQHSSTSLTKSEVDVDRVLSETTNAVMEGKEDKGKGDPSSTSTQKGSIDNMRDLPGESLLQPSADQVEVIALPKFPQLQDYVDYQPSTSPSENVTTPPNEYLSDDKILTKYKNTRFSQVAGQIDTTVADRSPPTALVLESTSEDLTAQEVLFHTGRTLPEEAGTLYGFYRLILSALTTVALRSVLWVQRHSGEELPIPDGHVRIRWKCSCGDHLYDDFIELRPGSASILEARLNRHGLQPHSPPQPGSRSSSTTFVHTPTSSSRTSTASTPYSSVSSGFGTPSKRFPKDFRSQSQDESSREREIFPYQGQRYLLTCISEARNTPKLSQVALHKANILSDRDLAMTLRSHWSSVNSPWYRKLRLRGLASIEFVQFYKHRNHFADIRKCPDVPGDDIQHDYEFVHSDVLPPVGPHYLVHLFQHPHEYDEETIAYDSIPKKTSRLQGGVGWGIQLVEGFLPERIWMFILCACVLFACVFALVWAIKEHDIQAGFGVAGFVTTLASIAFGFTQACLG